MASHIRAWDQVCVLLLTRTTWCPTCQPLPIPDSQKVFIGVTQAASSECTSGGAQKRDDQLSAPDGTRSKSREERSRCGWVATIRPGTLRCPESQPSATIDESGKAPRMRRYSVNRARPGVLDTISKAKPVPRGCRLKGRGVNPRGSPDLRLLKDPSPLAP